MKTMEDRLMDMVEIHRQEILNKQLERVRNTDSFDELGFTSQGQLEKWIPHVSPYIWVDTNEHQDILLWADVGNTYCNSLGIIYRDGSLCIFADNTADKEAIKQDLIQLQKGWEYQ